MSGALVMKPSSLRMVEIALSCTIWAVKLGAVVGLAYASTACVASSSMACVRILMSFIVLQARMSQVQLSATTSAWCTHQADLLLACQS